MQVVSYAPIIITCEHCQTTLSSDDVNDFRESHTYPPIVSFMCIECGQRSEIKGSLPPRLMGRLVNKIALERGYSDQNTFNRLNKI